MRGWRGLIPEKHQDVVNRTDGVVERSVSGKPLRRRFGFGARHYVGGRPGPLGPYGLRIDNLLSMVAF